MCMIYLPLRPDCFCRCSFLSVCLSVLGRLAVSGIASHTLLRLVLPWAFGNFCSGASVRPRTQGQRCAMHALVYLHTCSRFHRSRLVVDLDHRAQK
ncbi:hypothetical protein AG1IA_03993 [Rhizoctonia solani AG-1 IA]|uniref:Uncharacterized protein n=1 Tax=Thanatephorus cucumeris (strain AG1-IA) TaxID=983506 RepID=L8X031_THACA|nr:hypothetical protein AG1IA_03993 [Rhizoctonia solani AG-1 IA]